MARVDHAYVSSVTYLQQREILNRALDINNVEWNFLDFMELANREEVTSQPKYSNFVNQDVYSLCTVAAAGEATGQSCSVGFATGTVATAGITVGMLCFDHNVTAAVIGYVYSISTDTVVINAFDGSGGTSLTFTNSKAVSFFSNAAGEGSDALTPRRYSLDKYENQVQIFKGGTKITDIQKVSKIEVDYQGKPYYFIKQQHDALMKLRSDIAFSLMWGKKSGDFDDAATTAGLLDAAGNNIQLTGGLDEYIDDGVDIDLSTGAIELTDFRDLSKQLDLARAPSDYLVLTSSERNIELDDLWNAMDTTPILENARFNVDGRHLDMGVDSWRVYNRTYHKKWLPMLDAKNVTNFSGGVDNIGANGAWFLPTAKIKVDAGSEMVDRFRVRYMEGDGTNLKYKEFLTGGFAPIPTNNSSYLAIDYEVVCGLEILGAEHFAKMQ